ncbi:MAG: tyrosine-type recombinase/integrase [Candidatus Diapherotrites archaeon]|nr:tyrosine-type recombinase/integrase [Candidatus Diapherotrites archaeon]
MKKYVALHDSKFEREQMAYGSALRSLETARDISSWKDIFSEKPYSVEAAKEWWKHQLVRPSQKSKQKLTISTLEKAQGQASKFFKFLEFLETENDIAFFNTQKLPPAKASRYFIVEIPKKQKEIPRLNLTKFIEVFHTLTKSPMYYERLAGILFIAAYDLGCRFGELASLKNKSFQVVEGQLLINLEDSKTKTRTVVPILSKKYLINWQSMSPTRDDPEGYFFCDRKGSFVPYDKVSMALKEACAKVGFEFPGCKLWHYLRHEFASRAYQMPENLIRYYLGWSDGSIRAVYSHNNWKECLPYLHKMNEGHPLLDEPLSVLEKEETNKFESQLEQLIESKVVEWLRNNQKNGGDLHEEIQI